jgi:cytochrome oxidase Cu insertion factor (SCO1/SenC/PrrC family)
MKPTDLLRCFLIVNVLAVCLTVDADETTVVGSAKAPASVPAAPPCKHCKEAASKTTTPLNFEPFTEWLPANQRTELDCLEVGFTDQSGRKGQLSDFHGRPMVISFFYSRCQNRLKCPATVAQFAELQQSLQSAGLNERVTQLMISFEPQYDTPGRLNSYAKSHGMKCNDDCRMLQLDEKFMPQVVKNLDVPVNYNSGWVNIHGVVLYLVDKNGRLVRKYHTLLWDNQAVVADLTKLLKEEK